MDILEDEEIKALKDVMKKYDKNCTGNLNIDQFIHLIKSLSKLIPELKQFTKLQNTSSECNIIRAIFMYYDTDKDGLLSFDEIYNWWSSINKFRLFTGDLSIQIYKARNIFLKYSVNGKSMSYEDFEKMTEELNVQHEDTVFDTIDTNEDGLLNFKEFVDWLGWIK